MGKLYKPFKIAPSTDEPVTDADWQRLLAHLWPRRLRPQLERLRAGQPISVQASQINEQLSRWGEPLRVRVNGRGSGKWRIVHIDQEHLVPTGTWFS